MTTQSDFNRSVLLKPAALIVQGVPESTLLSVIHDLNVAYDAWKRTLADDNGMIAYTRFPRGGLLGGNEPEGVKPYLQIEPWEIFGNAEQSKTSLALRLWAENFEPFMRVAVHHGTGLVLAVAAMSDTRANTSTLIRVSGVLWDFVLLDQEGMVGRRDADPKAAKKRSNGGEAGNAARGRGKTRAATEKRLQIIEAGQQRRRNCPNEPPDDTAFEIHKLVKGWGYNYTPSTVRRYLSGVFGAPKKRKPKAKAI